MFKQIPSTNLKRHKRRFVKRIRNLSQHIKLSYKKDKWSVVRGGSVIIVLILIGVLVSDAYFGSKSSLKYDISSIESILLDEPVDLYAEKLSLNEEGKLVYNEGYSPGIDYAGDSYVPKFSAAFDLEGKDEVNVTDAVNGVSFSMVPDYPLDKPLKNRNRVVQPIIGLNATKVFTLKGSAIKEDLVLFEFQRNELEFDYKLDLPDNTEARIESDGSIGVYGISPELLGNISVGSEQDQALLEKLRNSSEKATILFKIPAPYIVEANQKVSKQARAWFSMPDRDTLRVHAANLENARYPLSIDPSVYIETARKLMRGNSETNIDFDTTNQLIQKGSTTGARFDSWDDTTQLNDGRWNGASATAGGFIYYAGGATEGGLIQASHSTPGSTSYVVPVGVTSVTIKAWGGGGGGGGASPDRAGGPGGGGGYSSSTISVTPGETLTVYVGGGGGGGTGNSSGTNSGNGGGGGGYSGVFRTGTPLIVAAGGGGGGGGNGDTGSTARQPGDEGGAGGGSTGVAGDSNGTTTGGGGGTQVAGGSGGTASGTAGSSLTGGIGGSNGAAQVNGGTNGGGNGGTQQNGGGPNKKPGGGGGGGGYYGGGGGGLRDSQYNGGGGGGGASSYTTGSPATNAAGVGQDPGNKNDVDRNDAGDGGGGGVSGATGSAGDNGFVMISYSTGGAGAVQDELYWAQLNDTNGAIESPNPGDGTCVNWCTSATYNLPAERQGHSMVSYNGFLYVMGGENDSGTKQSTTYIAKVGANGEPQLWHPNDATPNDKTDWQYWWTGTALSSARTYFAAVTYNNRLYVFGGDTASGGIATVESADIFPNGTLGSWSTTGMTALPSVRFGHTVEIYNGYLYLIGGNSGGTLQNSVHYNKLNDDGTMSTWHATEAFSDARMSWGGNNTSVWGGYMYLHGGCSAIDGGTGYCTTVESDTQLASINADGTITPWNTIIGLANLRIGHSVEIWRDNIYGIGGCNSQNPLNGQCADLILTNDYGAINQDGDASTVSDSVAINTGPCTGLDPYDCDTPPLGNSNGEGGQMGGGVIINNGFVYYIGGCRVVGGSNQICTNGSASRTADTVYYAEIATDGTLRRPAVCTGANTQYAGSWCVDNNNTINGSVGLAAFGHTVFNNTIYAIGGTDGASWQTTVYYTTLNADGSLNAWSSQAQSTVGLGTSSIGYPYVFARSNPGAASTNPGNLYVVGGCNGTGAGLDCNNTFFSTVYKCTITSSGALGTGGSACTTTGQTQLDAEPGTGGNQGLGIMAGTVYANYIYLIGGQSTNEGERGQVMYAKIDNSNNIIDADGEAVTNDIWQTSDQSISPARRRGIAFGYNGYLYALAGFAVDTGLNDLLFAKIDVSDGSIDPFSVSGVTVNQRWDLRGVVSSGYVYTLGGCSSGAPPATCNSMTSTVQTFQLYNNFSGSTSNYVSASNLYGNGTAANSNRIGASSVVLGGYLYMAGGCISASDSPCTDTTPDVQYAQISSNGDLGAWSTATSMPDGRSWGQLETVGGYLYYLGGQSDTATSEQSTVYYTQPASNGSISSWSTASGGIGDTASQAAQPRTRFSSAVWNNRIYVLGGLDASAAATNTVYISPQLSAGGDIAADSWSTDTDSFNVARSGLTTIAYANNLYILGGDNGTSYFNDVQYTQINADGTIDPWSYTTSLPQRISGADGFAVNGYMYLFGGRSTATTCTANTYITPMSANTTIASGNNPTGVGDWYQTREDLDGNSRYGVAAAYYQGKTYVLGGGCGSTLTYAGADRTLYATLFSQPQVARYSRMIDTDSDVFPRNWLMNGLDNDIGARWSLFYQSSTDSTNAWGQVTDFGTVTLGDVEAYIPRDGSGVDTEFARYYYFNMSIDSSQAYGYPDDVTRGPTISDLTLFFTSDPNKRLRHGKTFTGGEKQPLDTPCRQTEDSDCPLP